MSVTEELQTRPDTGESRTTLAPVGNISAISVEQANHELESMHDAPDLVLSYLDVLSGHNPVAGAALQSTFDGIGGANAETAPTDKLPVAVVLRNRYSKDQEMAIVGLLRRARPFEAVVVPDQDSEEGVYIAAAALGLTGFMQAVRGETKARGSRPDQPGRAYIDVMRYVPDSDTGLVQVNHRTALAVTSGTGVLPMLEAYDFGSFGRFAHDMLGIRADG